MSEKVLSVIIPGYNTSGYIDRCMESLLGQVEDGVEVVLVDDGSTDTLLEKYKGYAEKFPFIVVVHKENGGLASARNAGIEAASGEYIDFLDSDDWLDQGTIPRILNVIKQHHPDAIGYGCKKTTGATVFKRFCQRWEEGMHDGEEMKEIRQDIVNDKDLFAFHVVRSSCMHVFRKELIEKLGLRFVPEQIVLNEDYLFVMTYIMNAESYYCCKEYFYNYFFRENSLTTSYLKNMLARKNELVAKYHLVLDERAVADPELAYRIKLFYLNNCYECLANECGAPSPDKIKIKEVLDDIRYKDALAGVRMQEQSAKAKIFLKLMKIGNSSLYLAVYRVFSAVKKIRGRKN